MTNLDKRARRTYIANLLLTPFVATFFVGAGNIWQSPEESIFAVFLVILILIWVWVVVATAIGNLICRQLKKVESWFNVFTWHLAGISLGSLVGALVGWIMGTVIAAAMTGGVLGLVDAFIWWGADKSVVTEASSMP